MRLHIVLEAEKPVTIPVNYQEYLTAALYGYVATGDHDYATFVHDEGYKAASGKAYKPLTFSWLRVPASRRRIVGDRLQILPGMIDWHVSSPLDEFLRPFASGLLQAGRLQLGSENFSIAAVEALAEPTIGENARFTCLSPIVASVKREDGSTQFLRPAEDPDGFSEAIRKNTIAKFKALTGVEPEGTELKLTFDQNYLTANRGGTKKARFKQTDIIGIMAPFTVTGSPDLIQMGYAAGFGTRGAQGFGYVEVRS